MIERAVILSTGDELTTGRVVDTNSAHIAGELSALGVEVVAVLKVGDNRERLLWALRHATEHGDLTIGTGGLGPTADDLTTEMVAGFLGRELETDTAVAEGLKQRFKARGFPWTENNLKQALFPQGAEIISNPEGSAPGFRVVTPNGKQLIWLSGVPREMTVMLRETVLPWLTRERGAAGEVSAVTFKIHGLTESRLDEAVKPVTLGGNATLSFRAHYPDLSLRLTVRGGKEREKKFQRLKKEIRDLIQPHIYAEGDEKLEEVVGKLLLERGWTLAVAESCTGGNISRRITSVAGASKYFTGGATAYANEAKVRFLGVTPATLERHGAVSEETAIEMAEGIRREARVDVGLSVTGIAGPTGGSAEKPVGLVWVGLAHNKVSEARRFDLHGDRQRVILGASQAALNLLRVALLSQQTGSGNK